MLTTLRRPPARSCSSMDRPWRLSRLSICRCRDDLIRPPWITSRAVDTTAGVSTWRATGAPPKTATTMRRSHRAPTTVTWPPSISRNCAENVRFWFTEFPRAHCARRCLPSDTRRWWRRLALDAMVWTGEGSPTLEQRRKKLAELKATNRRPIDKAFIRSVFDRDHPDTAERHVIDAFADAVTALDNSVPTGTYVDMCSKLPVVDPEKIKVPTLIMRGQHDGIASLEDLTEILRKAPEPGQTVHHHAGNFSRQFPAEELHAGLSHSGKFLRAAGARLQRLVTFSCHARHKVGMTIC